MTATLRTVLLSLPIALSGCIVDLTGLSDSPSSGGSTTTPSTAGSGGAGGGATTSTSGSGAGGTTTSGGGNGGAPSCSPLSCGACQGPCSPDGCPVTVIANGPDVASTPLGLAVAPGALFWVNQGNGTVVRLKDDGSDPQVIASGADTPRTIAAAAGLVVWSAKDGVWACPPDACDAKKKHLAPPIVANSVREVAYDGANVFWTDRGTTQDALDGKVMRCDPNDCQPQVISENRWAPTGITLLDDKLLWTDQAGQYEDGRIMKGVKPSPGAEEISAGRSQPTGIAADDLRVYWTEYNAKGRVRRCEHASGYCSTTTNVAPALGDLAFPRDVALAGGRIYFSTTEEDGAVRSCPAPGCGAAEMPKVHASGRPTLHRMAVGATCVFFTDESDGGSVVKVAR